MKKTEFYNKIVGLTKKTGQGLELKIAQLIPGFSKNMLDELIDKGLLKMVHKPFNHLPSEDWICLTGIYCVEEDENNYFFMRYYLGFEDSMVGKLALKSGKTKEDLVGEKIVEYKEFLNKNIEGLEAIKRLNDNTQLDESLTPDTLNFLLTRTWFIKNDTVKVSHDKCVEANDLDRQQVSIHKQLADLYKSGKGYENKIQSNNIEMLEVADNLKHRIIILENLKSCEDKSIPVKDLFNV